MFYIKLKCQEKILREVGVSDLIKEYIRFAWYAGESDDDSKPG